MSGNKVLGGLLGAYLVLWAALFTWVGVRAGPSGRGMGGDLALFLAASRVQQAGGNPYNTGVTLRTETQWLQSQHVKPPIRAPFLRVGNPPVVYWALRPLAALPFRVATISWVVAMEIVLLAGIALLLRGRSSSALLGLAAALMPQTVLAAYYGNLDALVFISLVAAGTFLRRRPATAGAVMSAGWLKPQVGLPLAVLFTVYHPDARRTAMGLAAATVAEALLTVFLAGTRGVFDWLHALLAWSRSASAQIDLASLSGLYAYWAPAGVRLAIEVAVILAAVAVTMMFRRRTGPAPVPPAFLVFLWFLATPFAHVHDEVVLLIPLLLFRPRGLVPVLTVLALSVLLAAIPLPQVDLTSLGIVAAAALIWWASAGRQVPERSG